MTEVSDDIGWFTEGRGHVDADKWRQHLAERGIMFKRPGGGEPSSPMNFTDAAAFADALGILYVHLSDGTTRLYVGPRRTALLKRGQ